MVVSTVMWLAPVTIVQWILSCRTHCRISMTGLAPVRRTLYRNRATSRKIAPVRVSA